MTNEKAVTVFKSALSKFDIKEKVFKDIKSYTKLKIVDAKTEKDVKKARVAVRDIRYKIQNRQKELNSELNQKKKDIKAEAGSLIERLEPTETNLDQKIKAVEAFRIEEKEEKERVEKERVDRIDIAYSGLGVICSAPLKYNLAAEDIETAMEDIRCYDITEEVFQEKLRAAESLKESSLLTAAQVLKDRVEFEEQQKKIKLEKEEFKAKKKAEQEKLDKEKRKLKKQADKDAEKLRLEKEQLDADRETLEKEKAEAKAEKQREKEAREYVVKYNDDWGVALTEDKAFMKTKKKELKANKAKAKLLKADQKKLKEMVEYIDECITDLKFPKMKTEQAEQLILIFIKDMKSTLFAFDETRKDLI